MRLGLRRVSCAWLPPGRYCDCRKPQISPPQCKSRPTAEQDSGLLRTSIAKACRAAGIPLWSPHDLRLRRISLLHLGGTPWARIGEFVGQRNLSVADDTYTHVLTDETELDYQALLG